MCSQNYFHFLNRERQESHFLNRKRKENNKHENDLASPWWLTPLSPLVPPSGVAMTRWWPTWVAKMRKNEEKSHNRLAWMVTNLGCSLFRHRHSTTVEASMKGFVLREGSGTRKFPPRGVRLWVTITINHDTQSSSASSSPPLFLLVVLRSVAPCFFTVPCASSVLPRDEWVQISGAMWRYEETAPDRAEVD